SSHKERLRRSLATQSPSDAQTDIERRSSVQRSAPPSRAGRARRCGSAPTGLVFHLRSSVTSPQMTKPGSILGERRTRIAQRFNFVVKIMLKQFAEFCQTTASGWCIGIEMKFRVRLCQPQEQMIQIAEQPTRFRADTIGVVRHG